MPPITIKYAIGTAHELPLPSDIRWEDQEEFNLEGIESLDQFRQQISQLLNLESCTILWQSAHRRTVLQLDEFVQLRAAQFQDLQASDRLYIDHTARINRKQPTAAGQVDRQHCAFTLQLCSLVLHQSLTSGPPSGQW